MQVQCTNVLGIFYFNWPGNSRNPEDTQWPGAWWNQKNTWNQCSHTLSMQGARVAKKGKVGQGPRQAAKAWVCTFGLHQRSCLLDKGLWKEVYHPTSRKMIMHLQFSRERRLRDIHQAADSSPAPLGDHRCEESQSVNGRGMTLLLIVSRTCHHKKRRTFEP